ncbi:DNA-binding protein [Streptomyces collinus]|uniref:DNA-binding protein n=1 Tax=Streptomyces collinus TaxID=42684 RepID=UPI0037917546
MSEPQAAGGPWETPELLAAGAVLPPGTEGAGERAVALTARAYRHAALQGRTVVRLVPAELVPAEDHAAAYLGLEPMGEPEVVGLGLRRSLGFPEWVLVHHPEDGHHALAVASESERAARLAKGRPKAASDAYHRLAGQLAASVPHFLPVFYEQAGRAFLTADNPQHAGRMFHRARRAEAEYGLTVDEDRLDAVCLEFALAGALPAKALSAYGRELEARVPAEEVLRRFLRLCVRRTAGGLPPSDRSAADLRRMAKAAGREPQAVEQEYLAELLALPATMRAAPSWWKTHRAALVALARQDAAMRGRLLALMPHSEETEIPALWLEILESSGATAGLGDGDVGDVGDVPEEQRPSDGTAGWLRRFLAMRGTPWRAAPRLPLLYTLVERVADRLRAETTATASGEAFEVHRDLDLLDLLLSLGIPVADPGPGAALPLENWAHGEGQRDLLAVAADTRFRPAFHRAAERLSFQDGRHAVPALAASPGGRPMLTDWVREVARRSIGVDLPQFADAFERLSWLPDEALALAPDAVREATGADRAAALARTLRGGLFDELGWPAWEEAVADLTAGHDRADLVVADAWPYLITAGPAQARVLDADGPVLVHDLRIPAGATDRWNPPGFHYVDGELLVHWRADGGLRGYWHTAPDRVQQLTGDIHGAPVGRGHAGGHTLPLPGSGRTTGGGVLHRGGTAVPGSWPLISDGTAYWVLLREDEGHFWHTYDPGTGEFGPRDMPGVLSDTARRAPEGSAYVDGWVLPAFGTDEAGQACPVGVPVDGLLGWCVVRLPDGSLRGQDLAGRTVTAPGGPDGPGTPVRALTLPGDDRTRGLVLNHVTVSLVDPDGAVPAEAVLGQGYGTYTAGTALLPPLRYWHRLRPRDPEGSAVLRRTDQDTAAALLRAAATAAEHTDLRGVVRELLPGITHPALVAGVAGVVRHAAGQQAALEAVEARLDEALADGGQEQGRPTGPSDHLLGTALSGLTGETYWYYDADYTFQRLRAVGAAIQGNPGTTPEPETRAGAAPRTHLDGTPLPYAGLRFDALLDRCAAVAFRAAAPTTGREQRDALRTLLREVDALGLASATSTRWRWFSLRLDPGHLTTPEEQPRSGTWRGLLPLDGGAFLAVVHDELHGESYDEQRGRVFTALAHDPSGRFEIPEPYTVRSCTPVGETARDTDWLRSFLAEHAERGPTPWFPEAAREFARLTGVVEEVAALVVAGMPDVESHFVSDRVRSQLGLPRAEAEVARDVLRDLDARVRREVVAALLPAEPARLWTEGPDVASAAEVWLRAVGRRPAAPAALVAEAARTLGTGWIRRWAWPPHRALAAFLDPAQAPELSRDLAWTVAACGVTQADPHATGFTGPVFLSTMTQLAWLSHRLPAGDPVRAALPGALAAVRDRLAHPELLLGLGPRAGVPEDFRQAAGPPTETGEGYEHYGALLLDTRAGHLVPAVRPALLDAADNDPYLPLLRGDRPPFDIEVALWLARDPGFEAALADPGDPSVGERDGNGTWWPQDPRRSVPDVVADAARAYGIRYGLGEDAIVLYLMLLAMPDPTVDNTARWTGWSPARLHAAGAELAATDLVIEAKRTRAGRTLFLPGAWADLNRPVVPLEKWKLPLLGNLVSGDHAPLDVVVPVEPAAGLYRRAWQRVREGDGPRFEELKAPRRKRR